MSSYSKFKKKSYGVIAYSEHSDHSGIPYFLLVRRKYTYAYVTIIKGNYNINDTKYVESLISGLTLNEKNKILHRKYEYLWIKFWQFSYNNNMFKTDKKKAQENFNILIDKYKKHIISSTTICTEPEWGFPKGHKYANESNYNTAKREFLEESGLDSKDIHIYSEDEIYPICEEFKGNDGNIYSYTYYIGKVKSDSIGKGYVNPWNLTQISETYKIGWFTLEDAIALIKKDYPERINALKLIHAKITLDT